MIINIVEMLMPTPQAFADGLVAAGTTQATATPLTTRISVVGTVEQGSGVRLVAGGAFAGAQRIILNDGDNPLAVYPDIGGEQIGAQTAGDPMIIPPGRDATFNFDGFGTWYCTGANWWGLMGTTAQRPTSPPGATNFFDTTIGQPVWYYPGVGWVNAAGAVV